jgi:hypothetical protein
MDHPGLDELIAKEFVSPATGIALEASIAFSISSTRLASLLTEAMLP